ncbi:SCO family protein [Jatrophihabitans sp. YIM 134969]
MRARRLATAFAAAAVAVTGLAACGSGGSESGSPVAVVSSQAPGALDGSTLDSPIAKPSTTLTDTSGKPYDLATATKGRLVLLYFGYTHCPDVCPTTMADINVALSQVPAQVRNHTTVVFVTSDPARDTGPVLRTFLDAFDRDFVGLTGSVATIDAMADSVGVSIEPPVKTATGYDVTHGAQVLAFSPTDDLAHVVFTAGTGSDDYAHDLPLLASGTTR